MHIVDATVEGLLNCIVDHLHISLVKKVAIDHSLFE